jgi:hypothetical protein
LAALVNRDPSVVPIEIAAADVAAVRRAAAHSTVVAMHGFGMATSEFLEIVADFPAVRFLAVDHSSVNHLGAYAAAMTSKAAVLQATRRFDNLTVCSPDKSQTWPGCRFAHWPNPVDLPEFSPPPTIDPPCVAISSRADVVKAIPAQLAALAILQRERNVSAMVSLSGNQSTIDALRSYGETLGVRAQWLPYASYPDWIDRLRNKISLILQPSLTESFNYVTIDAAGMGRPFVGSSAIHHTPVEWRADPNDPASIARVAGAILDDYGAASLARSIAVEVAKRNNPAYADLILGGAG